MKIVLGKTAGFCFGVSNAVKKVEELLEKEEVVYCLGELVHNKLVIKKLEDKGLKIIENINEVPSNSIVVIRAHGITKQIYQYAKEKDIELYDLTCPKVLELHKLVEEYAENEYFVVIIGSKEHPENIGTISFAGEKSVILQEREEINNVIELVKKSNASKVLVIAQTTFSIDKFNEYIEKIKEKLENNIQLKIINTICATTKLRQEETKEIAKKSELMIIIGGKNSSNTTKLYDIAIRTCNNAIHIETKEDLYMNYVRRFERIGVMAGASTSMESINEIMDILKNG